MKISINKLEEFKPISINIEIENVEDLIFWWAQLNDNAQRNETIKQSFPDTYSCINNHERMMLEANLWNDLDNLIQSFKRSKK